MKFTMEVKTNRLYIHVPFCRSKCAYCAFYSVPAPSDEIIEDYFRRLETELFAGAPKCGKLESIYIGGGTPTWLSESNLNRLFKLISSNFVISRKAEITIECNPETLNHNKTDVLAYFVNRVSLGIQSFNCELRKILGRKGSLASVYTAIELLRKAGIDNLGCDLIYGIPGQSTEDWRRDLKQAVDICVKHISAYSLTVEEGTILAGNADILLPNNEVIADMWDFAGFFLKKNGFERYEISNYAKPGFECLHNLNIWNGTRYLGCGPSASSFDGKKRWTQPASIKSWLAHTKPEFDVLPPEKRAREIFVMGLRTSQGWERRKFRKITGFDFAQWAKNYEFLIQNRFLSFKREKLSCTKKGFLLWDEIAQTLI